MTRFKNAIFLTWWAFRYALITLRHKWFVMHGCYKANVPWWFWRALWHDMSKFGPSEIFAYGFVFCGPISKVPPHLKTGEIVIEQAGSAFVVFIQNRKDDQDEKSLGTFTTYDKASAYVEFLTKWRNRFMDAWIHHQNHNKHHWEYWIPRTVHFQSDPSMEGGEPMPMPDRYIKEMVGDWLGANRAYSGSWDMEDWLTKNLSKIKLHENSGDRLQDLLESMNGPAWVEGVFNSLDIAWDNLFVKHRDEFKKNPETWMASYFYAEENRSLPSIVQFTLEEGVKPKPWTRLLVRVNDAHALAALNDEKIHLKESFKDAGPGKVHIFYRVVEPEQRGGSDDDSRKPADESNERQDNDDGKHGENGDDPSAENGSETGRDGVAESGTDDGDEGGGTDIDDDEDVDEGDADAPDDDDGGSGGSDERETPSGPPSRSPSDVLTG